MLSKPFVCPSVCLRVDIFARMCTCFDIVSPGHRQSGNAHSITCRVKNNKSFITNRSFLQLNTTFVDSVDFC